MPTSKQRVNVVLDDAQHEAITKAAKAVGLSASGWARMVLLERLGGGRSPTVSPAAPGPAPGPDLAVLTRLIAEAEAGRGVVEEGPITVQWNQENNYSVRVPIVWTRPGLHGMPEPTFAIPGFEWTDGDIEGVEGDYLVWFSVDPTKPKRRKS